MKQTLFSVIIFFISFELHAQMLKIEERTTTERGISQKSVLEVSLIEIEALRSFDPAEEDPPISIKEAIALAKEAYKQKYGSDLWGIASASLKHFPDEKYRNRWYFNIDLFGETDTVAAVLFNKKVFLSNDVDNAN